MAGGINEMSPWMGSRGATASAVLMSILKCHVTIRNRCPYRFDSPETGGNNVSTRVTAPCLRAEGLHGITSQHAHDAFIFFQWLVIPASGPFSLIGYVSPLFAARPPSTLSYQPRIMENAASFASLSMDHGRTLIFHKYKKQGFHEIDVYIAGEGKWPVYDRPSRVSRLENSFHQGFLLDLWAI